MKVLLADDDGDQLELRGLALTKAGYAICTADSVEAALRLAVKEMPDVAVVDLKLPTEEAGLRLIRELKELDGQMRVIVLTGADPKKLEKLPERGLVEAVFTKGHASRQLAQHLKDSGAVPLRRKLSAEGQFVLDVKVIPRSSKSEIVEFLPDGSVKVKLAAAPEKGRANEELVALMAEYFGVRRDCVELVTGETSQRKRLRIRAA
jgi:hypothetical protein